MDSADGKARLSLTAGTTILDRNGQPLQEISVTARPHRGIAYEFEPAGARLGAGAQLRICFDPARLPDSPEKILTRLGFFQDTEATWSWIELAADFKTNCITAGIDRLGTFVLVFEIPEGPIQS